MKFRNIYLGAAAALLGVSGIYAAQALPTRVNSSSTLVEKIRQRAHEDYPGLTEEPVFKAVIAAIAHVDRKDFVPENQQAMAYDDAPLPIGYDQTISNPYVVAIMTSAVDVQAGSNILEVGTGSGYQAAILSKLGATVHSVEIVPELARSAAKRLVQLHFDRVSIRAGDGFAGWPEFAPYDGIIVTAGSAKVPRPLFDQLRVGGKLIMPIGAHTIVEQLIVYTKKADGTFSNCSLGPAMFVPLTGAGQTPNVPGVYDRSVPLCRRGQRARWPGQPVG